MPLVYDLLRGTRQGRLALQRKGSIRKLISSIRWSQNNWQSPLSRCNQNLYNPGRTPNSALSIVRINWHVSRQRKPDSGKIHKNPGVEWHLIRDSENYEFVTFPARFLLHMHHPKKDSADVKRGHRGNSFITHVSLLLFHVLGSSFTSKHQSMDKVSIPSFNLPNSNWKLSVSTLKGRPWGGNNHCKRDRRRNQLPLL